MVHSKFDPIILNDFMKLENINQNFPSQTSDDAWHILRDLRVKNTNMIGIGSLNINSIPNKFDALKTIIHGNIDIFVLTETKLEESFQTAQFCIEGFSTPCRSRSRR